MVGLAMVGRNGPAGVGRVNSSTAVGTNGRVDALFGRHISGGETRIRTVKSTSTGGNTATKAAPLAKSARSSCRSGVRHDRPIVLMAAATGLVALQVRCARQSLLSVERPYLGSHSGNSPSN